MVNGALSELDKSKLLNELELLPGEQKRRIETATSSGTMLDDPHERDIQRARVAQMPWLRTASAVFWPLMALLRWVQILSGAERSMWIIITALGSTVAGVLFVRRWLVMRRLDRQLRASAEDALRSPS